MDKIHASDFLVKAVQELSMVRTIEGVTAIVRKVARSITGADGATFILKDNDHCFYIDEDAIAPLWKGQKFPMNKCISGWVMQHKSAVIIKDIYSDDRIPIDAYRPTFVKSLAVVPIRTLDPIGAIGNYWANEYQPTIEQVRLLQSLADITAVSLENIKAFAQLEHRLEERSIMLEQLKEQNKQLEDFCYIISHNLRAPLINLSLLTQLIEEENKLSEIKILSGKLKEVTDFLHETFEELVEATQVRSDLSVHKEEIDLQDSLKKTLRSLNYEIESSNAEVSTDFSEIDKLLYPKKYLDSILFNFLSNALKYRSPERQPVIKFRTYTSNDWIFLEVTDNGLGIDLNRYGEKLFKLRKTFHEHKDARGFGLFITKTQIESMGGKVWATSEPGKGTIFTAQLYQNTNS